MFFENLEPAAYRFKRYEAVAMPYVSGHSDFHIITELHAFNMYAKVEGIGHICIFASRPRARYS
jgi:hypothetical protein